MKRAICLMLVAMLVACPMLAILPMPIDLPPGMDLLVGKLLGMIMGGALPVSDAMTHFGLEGVNASTALTAVEAKKIFGEVAKNYQLALEMAKLLDKMPIPAQWQSWLKIVLRDTYGHNAGWVNNANGTSLGTYIESVYPLAKLDPILAKLPVGGRVRAELRHAMAELLDSIHIEALDTIGGIRRTSPGSGMIIKNLWDLHFSPDPTDHGTVKNLDKIGLAALTSAERMENIAALLAAQTEMEVVRGQEARNAQAVGIEQMISQHVNGPTTTGEVTGGLDEAVKTGLVF